MSGSTESSPVARQYSERKMAAAPADPVFGPAVGSLRSIPVYCRNTLRLRQLPGWASDGLLLASVPAHPEAGRRKPPSGDPIRPAIRPVPPVPQPRVGPSCPCESAGADAGFCLARTQPGQVVGGRLPATATHRLPAPSALVRARRVNSVARSSVDVTVTCMACRSPTVLIPTMYAPAVIIAPTEAPDKSQGRRDASQRTGVVHVGHPRAIQDRSTVMIQ